MFIRILAGIIIALMIAAAALTFQNQNQNHSAVPKHLSAFQLETPHPPTIIADGDLHLNRLPDNLPKVTPTFFPWLATPETGNPF